MKNAIFISAYTFINVLHVSTDVMKWLWWMGFVSYIALVFEIDYEST